MNEAHLVQITRRRQIGGRTFERVVGHLVAEMEKRTAKPQIAAMRLSGRLAESVVDSPAGIIPDCRTCGACCAFYTCVAVEEGDPGSALTLLEDRRAWKFACADRQTPDEARSGDEPLRRVRR